MPEHTVPCCHPDAPCEDLVGDDIAALQQQCEDSGGCYGWTGYPCEDWNCEDVGVSCCDLMGTEGTIGACYCGYMWGNCISNLGGYPLCPGCSVGEQCDEEQADLCMEMATAVHVCCVDEGRECHVLTYSECLDAEGTFLWNQDECNDRVCGVGCREAEHAEGHPNTGEPSPDGTPYGPYAPTTGPAWGQKRHTTDVCYPVPMALVEPLPEHGLNIPPGYLIPATIGEVRNVAQGGDDDPCAIAYGVLAFGIDGYMRPYLCSRLDYDALGSAAYSEGVFCASPDNEGVVSCGYLYARVAVMAQPPREVQYHHLQLICGGIT